MQDGVTTVDLGDALLAKIIKTVQDDPLPPNVKARTLICAGKIAEALVSGIDGRHISAFTSSEAASSFPRAERQ